MVVTGDGELGFDSGEGAWRNGHLFIHYKGRRQLTGEGNREKAQLGAQAFVFLLIVTSILNTIHTGVGLLFSPEKA